MPVSTYHRAPVLPALAQSETKAKFMQQLDLDPDDPYARQLYSLMKEEAIDGRRRMTATTAALSPQWQNNPMVGPPYRNSQMSDTAMQREIKAIYTRACPETRRYYDLGKMETDEGEENWVIRWMLWHVFRYRDSRNKNRRSPVATTGRSHSVSSTENSSESLNAPTPPSATSPMPLHRGFYDPVRDHE